MLQHTWCALPPMPQPSLVLVGVAPPTEWYVCVFTHSSIRRTYVHLLCCLLQGFAVLTITPKHATSTWCGTPQRTCHSASALRAFLLQGQGQGLLSAVLCCKPGELL